MTYAFIRRAAAIAAASSLMATAATAAPNTWTFSQSYGADGTISGTFTGEDFNSDGVITLLMDPLNNNNLLAGNELQGLTLAFSGNVLNVFSGSFSQAEMIIGGPSSTVVEFQYVVGSLNMDAVLPGIPVKPSVVTLQTPVLPSTNPTDAIVFWTAGSATYDPLGTFKGNVTIFDIGGGTELLNTQTTNLVLIAPAPPVPEPAAYLMLSAGLALVGTAARRRARAQKSA